MILERLLDAAFALSVGMLGVKVMDRLDPADDNTAAKAIRAAGQPDVVRAAKRAGACQRRHDRLEGRRGAWAAWRRRHHWRRYQRWLWILQRRYWRHMRERWDPLEVAVLLLLSTAALGFMLVMAMIVETSIVP